MKLVKKILRLLPFIYLLIMFLIPMFTNLQFDLTDISLMDVTDLFSGYYDGILDQFSNMMGYVGFNDIYEWFSLNIADSGLFAISFGILCYELFISLLFLVFDFINMIFNWANKLIDKGGNVNE